MRPPLRPAGADPRTWRLALHEAGHAVLGTALRFHVQFVRLQIREKPPGFCRTHPPLDVAPADHIAEKMGGIAAELLAFGDARYPRAPEGDLVRAEECARAAGLPFNAQAEAERAAALLRPHFAAVPAIAAGLLTALELPGDRVRELIRAHAPGLAIPEAVFVEDLPWFAEASATAERYAVESTQLRPPGPVPSAAEQRHRVARYETGQAIVAHVLGATVKRLALRPEDAGKDWGPPGRVETEHGPTWEPASYLTLAWAGVAAEWLLFDRAALHGMKGDAEMAERLAAEHGLALDPAAERIRAGTILAPRRDALDAVGAELERAGELTGDAFRAILVAHPPVVRGPTGSRPRTVAPAGGAVPRLNRAARRRRGR